MKPSKSHLPLFACPVQAVHHACHITGSGKTQLSLRCFFTSFFLRFAVGLLLSIQPRQGFLRTLAETLEPAPTLIPSKASFHFVSPF